jgi:16S rRNA (guanine527-N7)-methyltransferase
MKKGDISVEVSSAVEAINILGGRLREVRPIELAEFAGEDRSLVVIEKVSSTPQRYPRRLGIPKKRPL